MYGMSRGGGWNKTHELLEGYTCLDSFMIKDTHSMTWKSGSSITVVVEADQALLGYVVGGEKVLEEISLSFVRNGFGGNPRTYFLCPWCGCRVRMLYLKNRRFRCRKCHKLNYRSQQVTRGTKQWAHQINNILSNDFGYKEPLAPYYAMKEWPRKPKGMHYHTFDRKRLKLLKAQVKFSEAFAHEVSRIMRR